RPPRRTGSASSAAGAPAARPSCRRGSAAAGATPRPLSPCPPISASFGPGPSARGGRAPGAPRAPRAARPPRAGPRRAVTCAGAHARQLAGDPEVTPVRGQAVVATNPGLTEFLIAPGDASAELAYLFPHGDTVILGGSEGPGDWNLEPDPAIAARILRDC